MLAMYLTFLVMPFPKPYTPKLCTLTSPPLGLQMRSGHEPFHEFGTSVVIVEAQRPQVPEKSPFA